MNICGDISWDFGLKNAELPQVMAFKQIGNHGDVTSHQIRGLSADRKSLYNRAISGWVERLINVGFHQIFTPAAVGTILLRQ